MSRGRAGNRVIPRHPGRPLLSIFAAIILFFLVAPVFIVFPMALSPGRYMVFPPPSFSFRWFQEFFSSNAWLSATFLSLRVSLLATLIATALGTIAAFGIARAQFPGKDLLYAFILSPWIVPPIIISISMYFIAVRLGLIGSALVLALAQAVLAVPSVVIVVASTLKGFDVTLEHAAMSLGANRLQTFWHVTFPLIRPGVLTGALLAFLVSFDDLLLALYLGGERAVTLPRRIWSGLRFGIDPTIAVVSTMLVILSLAILVLIELFGRQTVRLTASRFAGLASERGKA